MQVYKSDEGTYTCVALNDAGNDSHTAQIVVRGTLTVYISSQDVIVKIASLKMCIVQVYNKIFFLLNMWFPAFCRSSKPMTDK